MRTYTKIRNHRYITSGVNLITKFVSKGRSLTSRVYELSPSTSLKDETNLKSVHAVEASPLKIQVDKARQLKIPVDQKSALTIRVDQDSTITIRVDNASPITIRGD